MKARKGRRLATGIKPRHVYRKPSIVVVRKIDIVFGSCGPNLIVAEGSCVIIPSSGF
jgi:hypothetical protein